MDVGAGVEPVGGVVGEGLEEVAVHGRAEGFDGAVEAGEPVDAVVVEGSAEVEEDGFDGGHEARNPGSGIGAFLESVQQVVCEGLALSSRLNEFSGATLMVNS